MSQNLEQGKLPRSAWRWGFSCEFLLVQDILDLKVPELMKECNFGLFLKIYEHDFDTTYAKLLAKLKQLGIYDHFYPWPVLSLEDGYYPNIHTVDKFEALINRIMAWYKKNKFQPPEYVLVDVEPDVDQERFKKNEELRKQRAFIKLDARGKIIPIDPVKSNAEAQAEAKKAGKKQSPNIIAEVGKIVDKIDEMDDARFDAMTKRFQRLVNAMHEQGTKALCVALPITFSDLADGKNILQDFLTTPIQTVNWDMVNYMIFAEYTHAILEHDDFVHLVYSYCKDFAKQHGEKASICFGVTGFGKHFDQIDPALYLKEFNASLNAGVTQLGIFCLENILMLGEDKFKEFCTLLDTADGSFEPDPEKLEFAMLIRKMWEAVDAGVAPLLKQLVKSGRAMQLIQNFTKGGI
nr:hypothetical protein [Candidatus Sigynarchaeota archaeon]